MVKKIDFDPKIQLLFVFGLPKFATNYEFAQIKTENEQFQDMIIPSKYKLKITCYIFEFHFEILLALSELLLPSAKTSVQKG